ELGTSMRSELDRPLDEGIAAFEAEYEPGLTEAIQSTSEEWLGEDSELVAESDFVQLPRLAPGRKAYETHCMGCHGGVGDGAGAASRYLEPRPRNFRHGIFKFTSTDTGGRPLRRDIFNTITRGLKGSSMPDFRLLSVELRWDLTEYVRYIAIRGEFEQLMLTLATEDEEIPDPEEVAEIVFEGWDPKYLRAVYPTAPEGEVDEDSIARGRAMYLDKGAANCATCHGETGIGDGPSAAGFNDAWGYPIVPRDLTTGVFRAGSGPEDLYRSISTGVNGTPMTAYGGSLTPEEIWDLVHFVQSLSKKN
ncbi:MAG: mono/diheme cytochrome c family protein, partial [Planctomycetota bacterium]